MGTIYMKAKMEDVTIDNFKSYNFDDCEFSEIRQLLSIPNMREALVSTDIIPNFQERISYAQGLSEEECIQIMRNSERLWSAISTLHDYPSDVLMEFGHKLNLYYVEHQRNITPEFVQKYADSMDIGGFVNYRTELGDIGQFLQVPAVCERYIRNSLSWESSRNTVETLVLGSYPSIDRSELDKVLNGIFNTPINESTLTEMFSRENSCYSVEAVMGYFNQYHDASGYTNWEEYASACKRTNRDALINIIFDVYHRDTILKLINRS